MQENALVNGIKNSLSGEVLPSVKDLLCGNNIFLKKMLNKLEQNGIKAWNKIKQKAITDKNKYRFYRRLLSH